MVIRNIGEPMNVYLAGPMRGIPEFNFPAFDMAALTLRKHGHEVFSPADNDRQKGYDKLELDGKVMRCMIMDDLNYIANEADAIALLPGWQKSKGVAAEVALAKFLSLKIWELSEYDVEQGYEQVRS